MFGLGSLKLRVWGLAFEEVLNPKTLKPLTLNPFKVEGLGSRDPKPKAQILTIRPLIQNLVILSDGDGEGATETLDPTVVPTT